MPISLAPTAVTAQLAQAAADAAQWSRYMAMHEAIRLPLIGVHRLTAALAGKRVQRNRALERSMRRRYRALLARDFHNARHGLYGSAAALDLPLREYLERLPRLLADMPNVLSRIRAKDYRDLPAEVDLSVYPKYYLRTFHWQTDGYLSQRSAELYDVGVELLFIGCADVMRRQALAEVVRYTGQRPLRLLDVGAGTGRFLSQVAKCLPEWELSGVELSPWYARFAEQHWAREGVPKPPAMYVANAEALPFPDQSFEVVTSIFLLHELPHRVRRSVLREIHRVLVPGGLVVLEDAAQPSDSPELEPVLQQFARDMHEPFFPDYQRDDLEPLLEECGFRPRGASAHFVAKVVSGVR